MNLTPLRYHIYKLLSSGALKSKPGYRHLLSQETLSELKQRIKDSHSNTNQVVASLSEDQLAVCGNLDKVFSTNGKPSYLKSHKSGGIVHDVVLYKQLINGLKSKVIYNFINQHIASVSYTIQVLTKTDEQKINLFLTEASQPNTKKLAKAKSPGNQGNNNQPNEISLTFINHNPEVIQNINAAVYIDRYTTSNIKYSDSSKFQLTF